MFSFSKSLSVTDAKKRFLGEFFHQPDLVFSREEGSVGEVEEWMTLQSHPKPPNQKSLSPDVEIERPRAPTSQTRKYRRYHIFRKEKKDIDSAGLIG
jgi:hypothetical protein